MVLPRVPFATLLTPAMLVVTPVLVASQVLLWWTFGRVPVRSR
ncbi:hypothetical protein FHR32_002230 [Streptosporangium album]|uniref:Uncharacterized protein n=1 Tax=Streptosporangium album TaxID=47479 RepID=A0A7W7RTH0_9ACTN|nr:hypothetical protein [Streptosporangium album]MBB4937925.1 hypothetical protein [Streptosporangium album]